MSAPLPPATDPYQVQSQAPPAAAPAVSPPHPTSPPPPVPLEQILTSHAATNAASTNDGSSSSDSEIEGATSSLSKLNIAQQQATPPVPSTTASTDNANDNNTPLIKARSGCYTPNITYNAKLFESIRASLTKCADMTRDISTSWPTSAQDFRTRRDAFFTERAEYKKTKRELKLAKKEQKTHDQYFRYTVLGPDNTEKYNNYVYQRTRHQEDKESMERQEKQWMKWLERETEWKDDYLGWKTWVLTHVTDSEWKKLQNLWHKSKLEYEEFLKDQKKLKEEQKLWDDTVAPAWILWEEDIAAESKEWRSWRAEYGYQKQLTKPLKSAHKEDVKKWMDTWTKMFDKDSI